MITEIIISALLLFSPAKKQTNFVVGETVATDSIHWTSVADVDKSISKNIKKDKVKDDKMIMVDFYTDWCGWCKKLDNITYRDPEVIDLMNKYFYAIKFDAEQNTVVDFAGITYNFKANGNRGTHEFALAMGSRPGAGIGYPTISFIDPMGKKVAVEAGYKDPAQMKLTLIYYGEGHYKTQTFAAFQVDYKKNQLSD